MTKDFAQGLERKGRRGPPISHERLNQELLALQFVDPLR